MSKQVLIMDSTGLSVAFECLRKHQLQSIEHLEFDMSYKEAMVMGSFGHKLMEIYYSNILDKGFVQSKNIALDYNVPEDARAIVLADRKTVIVRRTESPTPNLLGETSPQIKEVIPIMLSKDKYSLIKEKFDLYLTQQLVRGFDFVPKSPKHVEVGFSEKIFESEDRIYILEGKMDGIGELTGLPCVIDHKFQLRARDLYKKSIQFRNYALVGKINTFIINYVRLTKSVSETTFVRALASFSPYEHIVWKQQLIAMFDVIFEAYRTDCFQQNFAACSGKFGYPCDFAPVCEEWDKQVIDNKKKLFYHIKEEWKPW